MNRSKLMFSTCLAVLMIVFGALSVVHALPASETDATKVPHYYGPTPNWVLSQLPTATPGTCTDIAATGIVTSCYTNADCPTTPTLETCVGASVAPGTGIKKFVDGLPKLCDPSLAATAAGSCSNLANQNNLGQYMPLAIPDTTTFTTAHGFSENADYYVIALVQHREKMSSSIPGTGTLNREYVQLAPKGVVTTHPLYNDMLGGGSVAATYPDGTPAYGIDDPHFLGPIIAAQKDRPVRIIFYNLLPTGSGGDLFLPVDTTFMGSGMTPDGTMAPMDMGSVMDGARNPMCGEAGKARGDCFADTRASIHLHGGITPWISDGSPHQWITPDSEQTGVKEGVAVRQVPDMVDQHARDLALFPICDPATDYDPAAGTDHCTTFYYTNQQSARLMFYHDHAWGITRLNVYAGMAAGYLISDDIEKSLLPADPANPTGRGLIPGSPNTIPLVIQDRTFVPNATQLAAQDPTWTDPRWGGEGDLWYEHVYMPAQNPNDTLSGGLSPVGRWFYGPWFWPPADPTYPPIANPYYDPACDMGTPGTWTYPEPPYCEPPTIPGTPNNSAGMEQFNDTPIVNGTAYPTVTVKAEAYRFRILNAANDRFFNLSMYVGDPATASADLNGAGLPIGPTEVALNRAELALTRDDPNFFPTPDTAVSPEGPAWVQIGTEGGFLAAPTVINNQPTTWIIDPTRFDVGNVNTHALTLGPAERADVIVDFSNFAGQTLILYNDAPAAFPARISTYDYYTGTPDLSPAGAPYVMPGYGPNTRTVMQIKVEGTAAATPPPPNDYNPIMLANLEAAFAHQAGNLGVFESGQHPIIVGQAAYNSAYGTSFTTSGWCNDPAAPASTRCDGYARISEQGLDTFKFNNLGPSTDWTAGSKIGVQIEPKALHDETNATNFEPYGRMSGNIGVEAVPATPLAQTIVLYPFVNPPTEIFDGTNLPKNSIGLKIDPIAVGNDGTQIWKLTHNGVDTHPIHFHLYDVQVLNRVTWDNIIIPPDPNEVGWKDTVRVSPLEDTYFAIRPIIPALPWELPNSIRPLNPMMPLGDSSMFNPTDPSGNPTDLILNQLVNFGWEYMLHCHILSHEEMDMMRPVSVTMPPKMPDGLMPSINADGSVHLTWSDNSIAETAQVVQRMTGTDAWANVVDVGNPIPSPLDVPNTTGVQTFDDTTAQQDTTYGYRIIAQNTVGYLGVGGAYPSKTAQSTSGATTVYVPLMTPTDLVATYQAATGSPDWRSPQVLLTWTDNAIGETGYAIERSDNGGAFTQIDIAPALTGTGLTMYVDTTIQPNMAYIYQVRALSVSGTPSAYSLTATVNTPAYPVAPYPVAASASQQGSNWARVTLNWADVANNTGYTVQWAVNSTFTSGLTTPAANQQPRANDSSYTTPNIARNTLYYFRIRADNANGSSAWTNASPFPIATP